MIEAFKIHVSDYGEALTEMSNDNLGALLRSLLEYSMDGDITPISDPTVKALSNIMCKHIDRDEAFKQKQSENGKKGGAPLGNGNAKKQAKTTQNNPKTSQNNPKQTPILSYPILSNNNKARVGKRNQFVDDCPKSEIDFEEIEKTKVKN